MESRQRPFVASALAMLVGIYLIAGPIREDRSDVTRLASAWCILLIYEFLVIGMIALLHRRGANTLLLTGISLFFLMDVVFLGDAYASSNPVSGAWMNLLGWVAAIAKTGALAWARRVKVDLRRAIPILLALGFIHLFPSLATGLSPRSEDVARRFLIASWVAALVAVPLVRRGGCEWAFAAAMALHLFASGMVADARLERSLLVPFFLALACAAPALRLAAIPAGLAVLCIPWPRNVWKFVGSADGMGLLMVVAAFILLGAGYVANAHERKRRPTPPSTC